MFKHLCLNVYWSKYDESWDSNLLKFKTYFPDAVISLIRILLLASYWLDLDQ